MARLLRKVIHISAYDSPNVQAALQQQALGQEPNGEVVLEGVVTWDDLQKRLALWDQVMRCVGIDGQFWKDASALLYPPEHLNLSHKRALQLKLKERRRELYRDKGKGLGCDPGEGGDPDRLGTAWCVVDEQGILELLEARTTDTTEIGAMVKALIRKYHLDPKRCCLDRGGGGKQIADQLRQEGYPVRTIGFGEQAGTPDPKIGKVRVGERKDQREDRYAYVSKRAQMYHEFSLALNPQLHGEEGVFAIPAQYTTLRQELAPIPLLYDKGEGRIKLPPKYRTGKRQVGQEKTLTELIGHSPDQADATVLAYHAMTSNEGQRPYAGGMRSRDGDYRSR